MRRITSHTLQCRRSHPFGLWEAFAHRRQHEPLAHFFSSPPFLGERRPHTCAEAQSRGAGAFLRQELCGGEGRRQAPNLVEVGAEQAAAPHRPRGSCRRRGRLRDAVSSPPKKWGRGKKAPCPALPWPLQAVLDASASPTGQPWPQFDKTLSTPERTAVTRMPDPRSTITRSADAKPEMVPINPPAMITRSPAFNSARSRLWRRIRCIWGRIKIK